MSVCCVIEKEPVERGLMEKICIVKRRKIGYENDDFGQTGASDRPHPQTLTIELTPPQMQAIRSNSRFQNLYGKNLAPIILNLHFEGAFPSRMLKAQELCDMLQVSKHTLDRLMKSGAIRSHRVGRLRRFLTQDVMEYLSNCFDEDMPMKVSINAVANSSGQ
jgi:excisionase family DNA binding protein